MGSKHWHLIPTYKHIEKIAGWLQSIQRVACPWSNSYRVSAIDTVHFDWAMKAESKCCSLPVNTWCQIRLRRVSPALSIFLISKCQEQNRAAILSRSWSGLASAMFVRATKDAKIALALMKVQLPLSLPWQHVHSRQTDYEKSIDHWLSQIKLSQSWLELLLISICFPFSPFSRSRALAHTLFSIQPACEKKPLPVLTVQKNPSIILSS